MSKNIENTTNNSKPHINKLIHIKKKKKVNISAEKIDSNHIANKNKYSPVNTTNQSIEVPLINVDYENLEKNIINVIDKELKVSSVNCLTDSDYILKLIYFYNSNKFLIATYNHKEETYKLINSDLYDYVINYNQFLLFRKSNKNLYTLVFEDGDVVIDNDDYKLLAGAMLMDGKSFNHKLHQLFGKEYDFMPISEVTSIEKSDTLNETAEKIDVSDESSNNKVYIWRDNDKVYFTTSACGRNMALI